MRLTHNYKSHRTLLLTRSRLLTLNMHKVLSSRGETQRDTEEQKLSYSVRQPGRNLGTDLGESSETHVRIEMCRLEFFWALWHSSFAGIAWEEREGHLVWLSFGHFVFGDKWRNTHPPDCCVCPVHQEAMLGLHFHPTNPVIRGCKKPRDLWHKESYCFQQWDFLWKICISHFLLSYQFCRDVIWVSASKSVCRPLLASSISTPTNCWSYTVLLSHCLVLTDDQLILQHHEQSEQKLSC